MRRLAESRFFVQITILSGSRYDWTCTVFNGCNRYSSCLCRLPYETSLILISVANYRVVVNAIWHESHVTCCQHRLKQKYLVKLVVECYVCRLARSSHRRSFILARLSPRRGRRCWCSLESQRSRLHHPHWHSGFKETKVSYPLTHKDIILWRASVPEMAQISCLEGSVIPFISPSSGGSPGPV